MPQRKVSGRIKTPAPWFGFKTTPQEMRELVVWAWFCAHVDEGTMTVEQVLDWAWIITAKNNVNVTLGRIRRGDRAQDKAWGTIVCELGTSLGDLTPLAQETIKHVTKMLKKQFGLRKKDLYIDAFVSSYGIVAVSYEARNLIEVNKRLEERKSKSSQKSSP